MKLLMDLPLHRESLCKTSSLLIVVVNVFEISLLF
jgi:hypothetical protein